MDDGQEVHAGGKRGAYETQVIDRMQLAIPKDVSVVLLADRGFGDQKLYAYLSLLGWDYVIRFRSGIQVENAQGERRAAEAWVPKTGRATMLKAVRVTQDRAEVPAVVVVHAARMKEPWCLATSLAAKTASEVVALYGKRFTIEICHSSCGPCHSDLRAREPFLGAPSQLGGYSKCAQSGQFLGIGGDRPGLARVLLDAARPYPTAA